MFCTASSTVVNISLTPRRGAPLSSLYGPNVWRTSSRVGMSLPPKGAKACLKNFSRTPSLSPPAFLAFLQERFHTVLASGLDTVNRIIHPHLNFLHAIQDFPSSRSCLQALL